MIHGLLLAAGASRRLGVPKLLLPAPGGTLLRRAARLLREAVPGKVVVVLGREAFLHRRALEGLKGVRAVANPHPSLGLSQSLKRGLGALPPGPVLAVPADQAGLEAGHLRALLEAFREPGVLAARGGEALSPAVLGEAARRRAGTLAGDRGAKGLLLELGAGLVDLGEGVWSWDVDTWEDYKALLRAWGWRPEGLPLPERTPYPALLARPREQLGPAWLAYGRAGAYRGAFGLLLAHPDRLALLSRAALTLLDLGL
ncbi:nucleotidyltransferase family protein [Thermus thermamylovorans]|uniref:MobA-like NTP transferase domain-containing protein n=1 Tax=Thermus thermamylovorans TaxID=2509362 RepID=A0A4Q9B5Q7_9DEIN|nr:NTP transferase domain-containing protein [Thermus thermamylovorans]TBH20953.1 hypothetical protein ETP66_04030 [Thermus thermamylovorans]